MTRKPSLDRICIRGLVTICPLLLAGALFMTWLGDRELAGVTRAQADQAKHEANKPSAKTTPCKLPSSPFIASAIGCYKLDFVSEIEALNPLPKPVKLTRGSKAGQVQVAEGRP